jgi:flagellar export protein FliJ
MAAFRFRAGAALDLRRRAEDAALAVKARAEARFREAYEAVEAADVRRAEAQATLVRVERQGSDVDTVLWHRNWIVRLTADLGQLRRDLDARAREVRAAGDAWREARRRRMAIERMRDRAWQRFQKEALREEMASMDELARIRFVMPDSWRSEP